MVVGDEYLMLPFMLMRLTWFMLGAEEYLDCSDPCGEVPLSDIFSDMERFAWD